MYDEDEVYYGDDEYDGFSPEEKVEEEEECFKCSGCKNCLGTEW